MKMDEKFNKEHDEALLLYVAMGNLLRHYQGPEDLDNEYFTEQEVEDYEDWLDTLKVKAEELCCLLEEMDVSNELKKRVQPIGGEYGTKADKMSDLALTEKMFC